MQKFERVQLEDAQVQEIAGGKLKYLDDASSGTKAFWSTEDPDTVYTFNSAIDVIDYIMRKRLNQKPDSVAIQELIDAGLIW